MSPTSLHHGTWRSCAGEIQKTKQKLKNLINKILVIVKENKYMYIWNKTGTWYHEGEGRVGEKSVELEIVSQQWLSSL